MTFDYTAMGFYTFDCLGRPVSAIPEGGETAFIDEVALAVSGTAGCAAIVAAKHGLKVQAVGGVGEDPMGAWVLQRLEAFGIDRANMQTCPDYATSTSMVLTRADGSRPVLHKRGATAGFFVNDAALDRVLDTKILHVGGVGLMDRMDQGRTADVMQAAKAKGCVTTLDVFAASAEDMALVRPLLPFTDYVLPSREEAQALTGLTDDEAIARALLDQGAACVVLTLGAEGAKYRHRDGTAFDQPAFAVEVVCSCGCGDCFDAGFATGLHLGLSAEVCVRMGQAASAQKLTGLGAQAGVVSLEETVGFMEKTGLRGEGAAVLPDHNRNGEEVRGRGPA